MVVNQYRRGKLRLGRVRHGALIALALVLAGCGGGNGAANQEADGAAVGETTEAAVEDAPSTQQGDEQAPAEEEPDAASDNPSSGGDTGLILSDTPTRFSELDWTVATAQRRPDGPRDDGEDTDPTEDFIYADLEVTNPLDGLTFTIPFEWLTVVHPDGRAFRAESAINAGTGNNSLGLDEVEPNRTLRLTVAIAIDAADDFDGGWFALDEDRSPAAAMAGPEAIDETIRIPSSVDNPSYVGPWTLAQSETLARAEVEVLEVAWARELGVDEQGQLITRYDFNTRRPPLGSALLLARYDVTCTENLGCNVFAPQVTVDGNTADGSMIIESISQGETGSYWAGFPVAGDAQSVSFTLGGETNFAVTDLSGLKELAG